MRLSTPPVFGSHFLAPRLTAKRQAWSGIVLDVAGETRDANLYRREADLAIRLTRPAQGGLVARKLGTMRFGVYAARRWLRCAPEDWEFVGYDETLTDSPQQQWLVRFARHRPFSFVTNDLTSILHACRAGAGLAVMPRFIAADDRTLAELDTQPRCDVTRDIWLVVHPDVRRSPRVRTVADALVEVIDEAAGHL